MNLMPVLLIGLFLGFKHATEADHLVAVTSIVSEQKRISKSSLIGILWGLGHTLSVISLGSVLIYLKVAIPSQLQSLLEFVVGIMIIALGISGFRHNANKHHPQLHRAAMYRKRGLKAFFVGIVHGFAGSTAVVLLVLNAMNDTKLAIVYLLVFGAGTMIGMGLVSTGVSLLYVLTKPTKQLHRYLITATSILSITFGIYYAIAVF